MPDKDAQSICQTLADEIIDDTRARPAPLICLSVTRSSPGRIKGAADPLWSLAPALNSIMEQFFSTRSMAQAVLVLAMVAQKTGARMTYRIAHVSSLPADTLEELAGLISGAETGAQRKRVQKLVQIGDLAPGDGFEAPLQRAIRNTASQHGRLTLLREITRDLALT